MRTDIRNHGSITVFIAMMILLLLPSIFIACTPNSNAKPINDPPAAAPDPPAVDLGSLFDQGNLWASSRRLDDAIVADPFQYAGLTGSVAYFRLLYMTDVTGANNALQLATGGDILRDWPQPAMLRDIPISLINTFDDILALESYKTADKATLWMNLSNAYGGITPAEMSGINEKLSQGETGFYTKADYQASICGFIALYDAADIAGFSPSKVLLDRYNDWDRQNNRAPALPLGADGKPDMVALMEKYDIVSYPYVLDYLYRQTGDPDLYTAMSTILGKYRDAIDPELLNNRIESSKNKAQLVTELCVLARLMRRMNAFTDDDAYIEAAQGIITGIAAPGLSGPNTLKLPFLYSLALVMEPSLHIVVIGPSGDKRWSRFAEIARDRYEPRLALMPLDSKSDTAIIDEIGYYPTDEPKCFVCVDTDCFPPNGNPDEMEGLIDKAYKTMADVRAQEIERMKTGE